FLVHIARLAIPNISYFTVRKYMSLCIYRLPQPRVTGFKRIDKILGGIAETIAIHPRAALSDSAKVAGCEILRIINVVDFKDVLSRKLTCHRKNPVIVRLQSILIGFYHRSQPCLCFREVFLIKVHLAQISLCCTFGDTSQFIRLQLTSQRQHVSCLLQICHYLFVYLVLWSAYDGVTII